MSAISSSLRGSSSYGSKRGRQQQQPDDDNSNLVKLCINKPKSWHWELTTSKSSPSIAFPIVQLFDKSSGALLAETNEADCQIRGKGAGSVPRDSKRKNSFRFDRPNIPEIIAESRDEELLSTTTSGQLPLKVSHSRSKSWQDDGISEDKRKTRGSSRKLASVEGLDEILNGVVDQFTRDGVDCKLTYRSSCERRRTESPGHEQVKQNYALGKSKSTTYVPIGKAASNSSSASTTARKKKYRRANSVNSLRFSNSILERIREYKRCTSSSDDSDIDNHLSPTSTIKRNRGIVHSATDILAEHTEAQQPVEEDVYRPKYTLRTSKAGTIVVCEESFRHRKVRRRPRSLSRHREDDGQALLPDGESPRHVVFSPEKVKTRFEYIGTAAEAEEAVMTPTSDHANESRNSGPLVIGEGGAAGEDNANGINRYQKVIDNIDKMLEKLKSEKATAGKSSTRRHKSLTGAAVVVGHSTAIDDVRERAPIRFHSHHGDDLSNAPPSASLLKDNGAKEVSTKRISFGKTTIGRALNDYVECGPVSGNQRRRPDINGDVGGGVKDNGVGGDDNQEVIERGPERTSSRVSSTTTTTTGMGCNSDKDKWSLGQRKQVRRTRRSLSADCKRLNDLLLLSSSDDEDENEDVASSGTGQQQSRGRSRTRRRRNNDKHDEGDTHRLIVRGDQVVAINNNVGLSKKEQPQTGCLIEPTDQVLLRLVRRLASLQHQQPNKQQLDLAESTPFHHQVQHSSKSINDNPDEPKHKLFPHNRIITNYEQNVLSGYDEGGGDDCGPDHNNNNNPAISGGTGAVKKGENFARNLLLDKENIMGSNVSRHSGKGLSGRRSLSSGNIFNGKSNPNQSPVAATTTTNKAGHPILKGGGGGGGGDKRSAKINKRFHGLVPAAAQAGDYDDGSLYGGSMRDDNVDTCSVTNSLRNSPPSSSTTTFSVNNARDRGKFCGSLPNYLDADDDYIAIADQLQLAESSRDEKRDAAQPIAGMSADAESSEKVEYVAVETNRPAPHLQAAASAASNNEFGGAAPGKPSSSSPFNSSNSGKGSITSTSNLGSTFKSSTSSTNDASRLELKLPVHRVNFDPGCDQGYGSERSPEDEVPPPLPSALLLNGNGDPFNINGGHSQSLLMMPLGHDDRHDYNYDFITKDCTFTVQITKGARGLGLSISGGIDSNAAFPGLIRIKRLFPHQAAWATGQLQAGDIILEVNGQPLSGLTNYEALEVLRTAPNNITLTVCRPEDEHYRKLSPPSEPPRPPQRAATNSIFPPGSLPLEPLTPLQTNFSGEFELIMVKQQGSLGFTLRKEDDSVLGHYVRALVRPPATDGVIKPGDKIVAVNDVPLSPMTHEEAVIFLRKAEDTVKLRLYRDFAQTPVAAMSPTNPEKGFASTLKSKQFLRPEAINLLSDLAYRKQTPPCDSSGSSVNSGSNTSPRRLKRGVVKGQPRTASTGGNYSSSGKYLGGSGQSTSNLSDSEASTLSQGSFNIQPVPNYGSSGAEETYTIVEDGPETDDFESITDDQQYYRSEEINDGIEDDDFDGNFDSLNSRPSYLNLSGQGGSTPVVARKPFSMACNGYELNNLDNELLDAPIYKHLPGASDQMTDSEGQDFVSLPCDTFIVACKTERDLKRMENQGNHFHHKNPVYQSVQVVPSVKEAGGASVQTSTTTSSDEGCAQKEGTKSLMKWKGVILSNAEEGEREGVHHATTSSAAGDDDVNGSKVAATNARMAGGHTSMDESEQITTAIKSHNAINFSGYKTMSLELNRGWNSRLGFSLKLNESTHRTYISAIYSDSVAARDGRLQIDDEIIQVNDEPVENMSTSQIIDLLRIIRGAVCLTILRKEEEALTGGGGGAAAAATE